MSTKVSFVVEPVKFKLTQFTNFDQPEVITQTLYNQIIVVVFLQYQVLWQLLLQEQVEVVQ